MLYALGYSHAMNKEAILIYEEKDKETKFPFDIIHIERIIYKNCTTEGVKLEKKLEKAIDHVMEKLTKTVMSDIKDKDYYSSKKDDEFKVLFLTLKLEKRGSTILHTM